MSILVIVPAYNEQDNIVETITGLIERNYEYVIINDCSTDNTLKVCLENNFNVINLPINLGLAGAVQTGFKYALDNNFDAAIQFDGDGQHLPQYIENLYQEILNGTDIVIGSRFIEAKKDFSARMLGSRMLTLLIKLTTKKTIHDPTSGMRMVSSRLFDAFAIELNHGPEPDTIAYLIKKGYSVKEVSVNMQERTAGESYLTFSRSIKYMLHMMISILFIQWFRK